MLPIYFNVIFYKCVLITGAPPYLMFIQYLMGWLKQGLNFIYRVHGEVFKMAYILSALFDDLLTVSHVPPGDTFLHSFIHS